MLLLCEGHSREALGRGWLINSKISAMITRRLCPSLARNGPMGPVWRCPLIGENRKSPAERQTDAIDPTATSNLINAEAG
jgi:hypothetical protein